MRISTAQWYRQSTISMLDNQSELSRTQLQLATGERLLAPSDDPAGVTRILELDQRIAGVDQYQRNIDRAESRLQREEQALEGMGDLLQRVRELAVQGLNDSLSAEDRRAIAVEVRQSLEGLVSLANEADANGEYLFSGYRTATPPFDRNASGDWEYRGDQGQRLVQIGDNRHLAMGDPGDRLFMGIDDGSGGRASLFAIVEGFASDLEADAPSGNTLTALDNAMQRLSDARVSIGGRMNAIENQRSVNEAFSLAMEADRSELEDLDYAEAVSRLQRQMLALQASQQTFMKVEGLSLFNYL